MPSRTLLPSKDSFIKRGLVVEKDRERLGRFLKAVTEFEDGFGDGSGWLHERRNSVKHEYEKIEVSCNEFEQAMSKLQDAVVDLAETAREIWKKKESSAEVLLEEDRQRLQLIQELLSRIQADRQSLETQLEDMRRRFRESIKLGRTQGQIKELFEDCKEFDQQLMNVREVYDPALDK